VQYRAPKVIHYKHSEAKYRRGRSAMAATPQAAAPPPATPERRSTRGLDHLRGRRRAQLRRKASRRRGTTSASGRLLPRQRRRGLSSRRAPPAAQRRALIFEAVVAEAAFCKPNCWALGWSRNHRPNDRLRYAKFAVSVPPLVNWPNRDFPSPGPVLGFHA
jgi:hypothetical protein